MYPVLTPCTPGPPPSHGTHGWQPHRCPHLRYATIKFWPLAFSLYLINDLGSAVLGLVSETRPHHPAGADCSRVVGWLHGRLVGRSVGWVVSVSPRLVCSVCGWRRSVGTAVRGGRCQGQLDQCTSAASSPGYFRTLTARQDWAQTLVHRYFTLSMNLC